MDTRRFYPLLMGAIAWNAGLVGPPASAQDIAAGKHHIAGAVTDLNGAPIQNALPHPLRA